MDYISYNLLLRSIFIINLISWLKVYLYKQYLRQFKRLSLCLNSPFSIFLRRYCPERIANRIDNHLGSIPNTLYLSIKASYITIKTAVPSVTNCKVDHVTIIKR
jgi:hypothetical protein